MKKAIGFLLAVFSMLALSIPAFADAIVPTVEERSDPWLIFALILVIFALRYGMAVFDAVDPVTAHQPALRLVETVVRGALSGLLVGRGLGVLLSARAMRAAH